jgi:hypothetical protein
MMTTASRGLALFDDSGPSTPGRRGLTEEPVGGSRQVSLVGEARIGCSEGDRLVRQAEHGRPQALPRPQACRRRTGEIMDQCPQAGRRHPDTGGDVVDALGGWETPKRGRDARIDRERRRQQVSPSKVCHGPSRDLVEIGDIDPRPHGTKVLDGGGIERDGGVPAGAESLEPRVDEHRDVADGAGCAVRNPRREYHPGRAPAGTLAGGA